MQDKVLMVLYALISQHIAMIIMVSSPWKKKKSKNIEKALGLETF